VLCAVRQSYPTAGGNSVVQHREQQSYLGKDQPWPQLATAAMTAMVVSLDLIELAREVRGVVVVLPSNACFISYVLDAAAAVGAELQLGPDQLRRLHQRAGGLSLVRLVCRRVVSYSTVITVFYLSIGMPIASTRTTTCACSCSSAAS
jgi:hypothetical protein